MATQRDADKFRGLSTSLDQVGADGVRVTAEGRPQVRVNGQWLFSDTTVTRTGSPAVLANPTPAAVAPSGSGAPPSVVQLGTPLGDVAAGG